jgi:hypothetical protein
LRFSTEVPGFPRLLTPLGATGGLAQQRHHAPAEDRHPQTAGQRPGHYLVIDGIAGRIVTGRLGRDPFPRTVPPLAGLDPVGLGQHRQAKEGSTTTPQKLAHDLRVLSGYLIEQVNCSLQLPGSQIETPTVRYPENPDAP